jgi:hypothetical protein
VALPSLADRRRVARAGVTAIEIISVTRTTPHALTPFARVVDTKITYAPEGLPL